jgi:hypothetical protein
LIQSITFTHYRIRHNYLSGSEEILANSSRNGKEREKRQITPEVDILGYLSVIAILPARLPEKFVGVDEGEMYRSDDLYVGVYRYRIICVLIFDSEEKEVKALASSSPRRDSWSKGFSVLATAATISTTSHQ